MIVPNLRVLREVFGHLAQLTHVRARIGGLLFRRLFEELVAEAGHEPGELIGPPVPEGGGYDCEEHLSLILSQSHCVFRVLCLRVGKEAELTPVAVEPPALRRLLRGQGAVEHHLHLVEHLGGGEIGPFAQPFLGDRGEGVE